MAEGASAYADTTELAARWRALTTAETPKAELYLDDVTRDIRRSYPDIDDRMGADPDLAVEVARITCNVVRRRMNGEEFEDVEQQTDTEGPYGQSRTFRSTRAEHLELTSWERRILAGQTSPGAATSTPAWSNEP